MELERARARANAKHSEICRNFVKNFLRIKREQRLSIRAIANRAGLAERQIASILSRCEQGKTMQLKTLVAVAIALDAELSILLTRP